MQISALSLHPVKSTAVRRVQTAYVGRGGLAGDREWMVVDADGQAVTAREVHALFAITADTPATDAGCPSDLRLSAAGHPSLDVAIPVTGDLKVRLFTRPPMPVRAAGPDADAWLRQVLGIDGLRLVWCSDPTERQLNPAHSRPDDFAAFPDGYPITLVTDASLDRLNEWIAQTADEHGEEPLALPMARFRPNVVVEGADAFAEDAWSRVRLGDVECRVVKGVDRCVMTTIDPLTLATAKEPIRTLARHRRWEGKTWFCRQVIPDGTGPISVGDEVVVLD